MNTYIWFIYIWIEFLIIVSNVAFQELFPNLFHRRGNRKENKTYIYFLYFVTSAWLKLPVPDFLQTSGPMKSRNNKEIQRIKKKLQLNFVKVLHVYYRPSRTMEMRLPYRTSHFSCLNLSTCNVTTGYTVEFVLPYL